MCLLKKSSSPWVSEGKQHFAQSASLSKKSVNPAACSCDLYSQLVIISVKLAHIHWCERRIPTDKEHALQLLWVMHCSAIKYTNRYRDILPPELQYTTALTKWLPREQRLAQLSAACQIKHQHENDHCKINKSRQHRRGRQQKVVWTNLYHIHRHHHIEWIALGAKAAQVASLEKLLPKEMYWTPSHL